jgi:SAM-dependent methyltransferase/uncharacterized protein YbaR (Trm112 family)
LRPRLRCPRCEGSVAFDGDLLQCANPHCGQSYPVIDRCPILINDDNSAFCIDDFVARRRTTGQGDRPQDSAAGPLRRAKALLRRFVPDISYPLADFGFDEAIPEMMADNGDKPWILVIGAGDRQLRVKGNAEFVYTDVALLPLTQVVGDAHDIPFADGTFDAVLADSVLEHVADPARCVAQIHRVLKPGGYVYAVSPFMIQVHMGPYDFNRFTHLGHRRLFRAFEECRSGVACGPGMALAWSFERFVASFGRTPSSYALLRSLARFLIFPVKYFDHMLVARPGAYDCAGAYYFFGRRSNHVLSDRDLIRGYRGLIR